MPLYHMQIEWTDDEGIEQQSPHLFCWATSAEKAREVFITEKDVEADPERTDVIRGEGWKEEYGPFNSKELFKAAQKAKVEEIKTLDDLFVYFPGIYNKEFNIIESAGW